MTIEEVIETLKRMYEVGQTFPFMYDPVGYALSKTQEIYRIKTDKLRAEGKG